MAKRENDLTPAEDYMAQLEWQARHRRRMPVRFEPKWKYKIVHRLPPITPFGRIVRFSILLGVILLIIYLVASDTLVDQVGMRIFLGCVFGLIFAILFFAIRDASDDQDDGSNEPD